MAKAFISGVNGFIGSHLAQVLLERGDEVVGLVRTTSDTHSLAPLFERYGHRFRIVVGDLRDPQTLGAGLEDVEYVFHLAAVLLGISEAEFVETNVDGTKNLLEAVMRHRTARLKRFVFTSSLAAAGPSPDDSPINETRPPAPVSWYGKSKVEGERIVMQYASQGLPVTIGRPVAVYGERERDLSGGTFPIVKLGVKPMIGFKRKKLSMVYVGDLVAGLVAAAESNATLGKTYFFSDQTAYRDTEVVAAAADAMGKRIRIPVITPQFLLPIVGLFAETLHRFTRARPVLTRDKAREVQQRWWVASAQAADTDFGWTAHVSLAEGMKRAVTEWKERRARRRLVREPIGDRAVKTYLIALGFGIVVEGIASIGQWYEFDPWWLIFVVIVAVFGVVLGSISLFFARSPAVVQFVLGAIVGVGAELLNHFWLHTWEFAPAFLARLPSDPWMLALALGLPAGLMPVLVNAIVQTLYSLRLRLG